VQGRHAAPSARQSKKKKKIETLRSIECELTKKSGSDYEGMEVQKGGPVTKLMSDEDSSLSEKKKEKNGDLQGSGHLGKGKVSQLEKSIYEIKREAGETNANQGKEGKRFLRREG